MDHETIDFEAHWSESSETYENHPTSLHRRRFVLNRLQRVHPEPGMFVFDYGCGAGTLLADVKARFQLADGDLGGCDTSEAGVDEARTRLPGSTFYLGEYPQCDRPIDIALTTEVIEHTSEYEKVLDWLVTHLAPGGHLIITTPGGTLDPPDRYYGHIQHFTVAELAGILEKLGCSIECARSWGFPLFTLQKWITKRNFSRIRERYMEGGLDTRKRLLFRAAYYAYFVHDLMPWGPQIFIHARKT